MRISELPTPSTPKPPTDVPAPVAGPGRGCSEEPAPGERPEAGRQEPPDAAAPVAGAISSMALARARVRALL